MFGLASPPLSAFAFLQLLRLEHPVLHLRARDPDLLCVVSDSGRTRRNPEQLKTQRTWVRESVVYAANEEI